jgi:SET domain-containing protein
MMKIDLRKDEQRVKRRLFAAWLLCHRWGMQAFPLYRHPDLYLNKVEGKGLGLFCVKPLEEGETVESAPALLLNADDLPQIDRTRLYNYYFAAKFLTKEQALVLKIEDREKAGFLVMGALSYCNHAENPNAKIEKIVDGDQVYFILKTSRAIDAQEEITISYGRLWFEAFN